MTLYYDKSEGILGITYRKHSPTLREVSPETPTNVLWVDITQTNLETRTVPSERPIGRRRLIIF